MGTCTRYGCKLLINIVWYRVQVHVRFVSIENRESDISDS